MIQRDEEKQTEKPRKNKEMQTRDGLKQTMIDRQIERG
jgi:hypothetical protein